MNNVYLLGNVGKSDVRELGPDKFAINFSLATRNSWKDKAGEWKEETEWHNVVYYTKDRTRAPLKGNKVFVEGSLTTRSYEKDGQKRYITEVKAKNITIAADKPGAFVPPSAPVFDDSGAFKDEAVPF